MSENGPPSPPLILAAANIHPDYVEICVDGCCTGSRFPSKLPVGTITLARQTAGGGGSSSKGYGVVGLWYYAGDSRKVAGADLRWPRKWSWQVGFEPLVRRFEKTFCEEFSVPVPGGAGTHRSSLHVPDLIYTHLQGTLVRVPAEFSAAYLRALMKGRRSELLAKAPYLGREVRILNLLDRLARQLEQQRADRDPPR